MMIEIADKAGFCFGVARAVKIAYENAEKQGRTACFGMLIHNRDVIGKLEEKGVVTIDNIADAETGMNIIIRAHGIPESVQTALEGKGVNIIDATCPFVKKIHSIVNEAY